MLKVFFPFLKINKTRLEQILFYQINYIKRDERCKNCDRLCHSMP